MPPEVFPFGTGGGAAFGVLGLAGTVEVDCYALTLPLGRGSQLGLGPRDNGQERNGLPDPGRGPKDR